MKVIQHSVNAPVSFVVKHPIVENDTTILIEGISSDDVLYGNGYTKGAFDMSNRYMAGDGDNIILTFKLN